MQSRLRPLMLGLAAMLVAGCHKPIEPRYESTSSYGKVTLSDMRLRDQIVFGDAQLTRNEVGLLRMTQPVRERKGRSIWIEYRVIWLDESRQPIHPQMTWRAKRLESAQPDYLAASATSTRAIDYRLEVRRADR